MKPFLRRRGFTLLEVVATLAVLSILAAAVVPNLAGYLTRRGVEKTADTLNTLAASIASYRVKVNRYPFRISHLGSPIKSADSTSCSGIGPATPVTTYGGLNYQKWGQVSGGPFYLRTIPTTGLPTPIGTIIDTIYRTGAGNSAAAQLPLIIRNVRFEDADDLNAIMEGDANNGDNSNTLGNVTWGVPVNGLVDVQFMAVTNTAKTC